MTKNEHVYATCCRPEVVGDVVAGPNVKIIKCYPVVNFEGASFSSFQDIPKGSLCDGEVGDGSSAINVICNRPEVDDDVISGKEVENF